MLPLLWALALLLPALPQPRADLQLAPASPSQGQALIVAASGLPPGAQAVLTWDRRRYPIYHLSSGWRAVVPVRIEETPGRHTVRMVYAPLAYLLGAAITLVTALLLLLYGTYAVVRRLRGIRTPRAAPLTASAPNRVPHVT